MNEKYLYSINNGMVSRYLITRETKANYWIQVNISQGGYGEEQISKKTMRTGSTWHFTHYEKETEELIDKWKYDNNIRGLLNAVESIKLTTVNRINDKKNKLTDTDIELCNKIIALKKEIESKWSPKS